MDKLFVTRLWLFSFMGVLLLNACTSGHGSLESLLQTELDELCKKHNLPGMTAAFVLENGRIGSVSSGLADKEYNIPMTPQSRMLAASIGKTFVAATCVALAQKGVLDLDKSISAWLGEYDWFDRLANHDIITLRQLLSHTSGLPDHVFDERFAKAFSEKWNSPTNPFPPDTLIAYILDREPRHHPGRGWSYSDTGYILVGLIIEKATGKEFYEVVSNYFINPLRLGSTSPSDRPDLEGLASGYLAPDNDFGLPVKTTHTPGIMTWHPGTEWTGGGFISTSQDLAKWFKFLFSPSSEVNNIGKEMLNAVPMHNGDSLKSFGLGVFIQKDTPLGTTYGHSGWIPGYRSNVQYYPEYDMAVSFQINTDFGFQGNPVQVLEEIRVRLAKIVAHIDDKP